MKKRILWLLPILALLLALLPAAALNVSAQPPTSGTCGSSLSWSYDADTAALTVSGSGEMYDFGYGLAPWGELFPVIETVTLPEGLTNVGSYAFTDCDLLERVELPSTVVRIGRGAFANSDNLAEVVLPEGLKQIGASAFFRCSGLVQADLPQSLVAIGDGAFWYCGALASVRLPDGLQELEGYAFADCSSLETVAVPEGIENLNWYCFFGCSSLTSVTLPQSMKYIDNYAFAACTSLETLTLPAGLLEIGDSVFEDCSSLSELKLPATLQEIGGKAFSDCVALRSVDIPKSVEKVRGSAFSGCTGLKQLIFRNPDTKLTTRTIKPGDETPEDLDWTTQADRARGADLPFDDDTGEDLDPKPDPYGPKEQVVFYGKHDPAREDSPETADRHEMVRLPESFAKALGYTFYATNVFSDVKEGKFYEIPVAWAYGKGVTSGVDATHFGPKQDCTRAQVVTFLWNAMGQPEPTITEHPFTDVKPGKFYYNAMLWAYENGVTSGVDATHFGPSQTCTRGQVVTFLWNAMGQPAPTVTEHSFVDVKPGKYYYNAMLWALENGITAGIDETHFAPSQTCTRGQVVTFLYNTMGP